MNKPGKRRKQIFWRSGTLPATRNDLIRTKIFMLFAFCKKRKGSGLNNHKII
jgi:hypothetical protein